MFDVAPTELLLVAIVALVVIGPKDLPKAMRVAGYWVGKARGVARQFRSGFDAMVREAELAEMEKKWKAENERIMREHPPEALAAPQDALAAPQDALPAPEFAPETPHEDPNAGKVAPGTTAMIVAPHEDPAATLTPQPEIRDEPEAPAHPDRVDLGKAAS